MRNYIVRGYSPSISSSHSSCSSHLTHSSSHSPITATLSHISSSSSTSLSSKYNNSSDTESNFSATSTISLSDGVLLCELISEALKNIDPSLASQIKRNLKENPHTDSQRLWNFRLFHAGCIKLGLKDKEIIQPRHLEEGSKEVLRLFEIFENAVQRVGEGNNDNNTIDTVELEDKLEMLMKEEEEKSGFREFEDSMSRLNRDLERIQYGLETRLQKAEYVLSKQEETNPQLSTHAETK